MLAKNNKKFFYTLWIVLFPVFNRYTGGIPYLTLAETGMIIIVMISMIIGNTKLIINKDIGLFCIYLIIEIGIAVLRGMASFDLIGSTLRLLFLYVVAAVFANHLFDIDLGIRLLKSTGVFVSIYAVFQVVFSYIGIYLPTYIRFFNLMDGKNTDEIVMERVLLGMRYRPHGIFNEPAQLCTYLVLVLAVFIFSADRGRHWYVYAVLVSAASVISLSSTGIISVGLIWFLYFLEQMKTGHVKRQILIAGFLIFLIGSILMIKFHILDYFLFRTFGTAGNISGILQSTRFADLRHAFDRMDDILSVLFGNGIIELDGYLPGYARLFQCLGFLGLFIMIFVFLKLCRKADKLGKKILLLYIVLNIGTEVMFGNFLVLYLPFVVCSRDRHIQ